MRSKVTALVAVLAAFGLTGCGAAAGSGGDGSIGGPDKAVTVDEALRSPGSEPIRVRGALVTGGDQGTRMCDSLAESYPPQCPAGAELRSFHESVLPPETSSAQGFRWVESIELIVTSDGERLTVVDE